MWQYHHCLEATIAAAVTMAPDLPRWWAQPIKDPAVAVTYDQAALKRGIRRKQSIYVIDSLEKRWTSLKAGMVRLATAAPATRAATSQYRYDHPDTIQLGSAGSVLSPFLLFTCISRIFWSLFHCKKSTFFKSFCSWYFSFLIVRQYPQAMEGTKHQAPSSHSRGLRGCFWSGA